MMVARWSINARFGYKQNVIDALQRWLRDIAPQVGFTPDRSASPVRAVRTVHAGPHPAAHRFCRHA